MMAKTDVRGGLDAYILIVNIKPELCNKYHKFSTGTVKITQLVLGCIVQQRSYLIGK